MIETGYRVLGEDQLLHIPYKASDKDGRTNIGYIDLKLQPERISEIHEFRGYPELETLVRWLMRPECIFRPLRVATEKDYLTRPGLTKSKVSVVTISFDRPGLADDDALFYRQSYDSFLDYASRFGLSVHTGIFFELIPLIIDYSNYRGWCLDMKVVAYGRTTEEAHYIWSSALQVVKNFLALLETENK